MKRLICAAVAAFVLSATAGQAQNRNVQVVNDTSHTIYQIYASSTSRGDWGWDRLGSNTLPSGWNVWVDMSDGTGHCWMDLKAVSAEGLEWRSQQNVCEIVKWRLVD